MQLLKSPKNPLEGIGNRFHYAYMICGAIFLVLIFFRIDIGVIPSVACITFSVLAYFMKKKEREVSQALFDTVTSLIDYYESTEPRIMKCYKMPPNPFDGVSMRCHYACMFCGAVFFVSYYLGIDLGVVPLFCSTTFLVLAFIFEDQKKKFDKTLRKCMFFEKNEP